MIYEKKLKKNNSKFENNILLRGMTTKVIDRVKSSVTLSGIKEMKNGEFEENVEVGRVWRNKRGWGGGEDKVNANELKAIDKLHVTSHLNRHGMPSAPLRPLHGSTTADTHCTLQPTP